MNAPLYTREILRLAASLGEPAVLARVDGVAERRSRSCGSRVRVEAMIVDGRIEQVSQRVEACAFGQAAAALMLAGAGGRSAEDVSAALDAIRAWLEGDDGAAHAWPGLTVLEPARSRAGRHGAILLPFEALLGALSDGGPGRAGEAE